MTEEFLTFRRFPDKDSANEFAEELAKAGIDYRVESVPTTLDSIYIGDAASPMFSIKIPSVDFKNANLVLNEYYKKLIETVDKDYYLFSFSDAELFEIIAKPDEWGHFDYQLAQKILDDRGNPVDQVTMNRLEESRVIELAKPEKDGGALLIIGYLVIAGGLVSLYLASGLGFLPYGVILSTLTGSLLAYNKKILPDGSKVYSYDPESRKHGKIIMVASVVILCFCVFTFIRYTMQE